MDRERVDVRIPSHGEQLAAYLYRPAAGASQVPCVVMAHGFSATRQEIPSWPSYMSGLIALRPVATVEPVREIGGNNEHFQGVRQRPQPSR